MPPTKALEAASYFLKARAGLNALDRVESRHALAFTAVRRQIEEDIRAAYARGISRAKIVPMAAGAETLKLPIRPLTQEVNAHFARLRLTFTNPKVLKRAGKRIPRANIYRAQAAVRRQALQVLDELGLEHPSKAQQIERLRTMIRDQKENLVGVERNESKAVREDITRISGGWIHRGAVAKAAASYRLNRNIYDLSVRAHFRGLARGILWDAGIREKVLHWLVALPSRTEGTASPQGLMAKWGWRVMSTRQVQEGYRALNEARRRPTSPDGLGLHHNSTEIYIPIPKGIVDDMKTLAAERRRQFLEGLEDGS